MRSTIIVTTLELKPLLYLQQHFVLNMRSLIWGFGDLIVHRVTSQSANVSANVLFWHFHRPLTSWLKFESNLAGSKSVSASSSVLPGYDDDYHSRSCCSIEWQKMICYCKIGRVMPLENPMLAYGESKVRHGRVQSLSSTHNVTTGFSQSHQPILWWFSAII